MGHTGTKKNKFLSWVGIAIIIFTAVFLATLMIETNSKTKKSLDILKNNNIEDFSFYPTVDEEDIINENGDYDLAAYKKVESLSEKYDFTWEERDYKVANYQDNIYRIYNDQRDIDKYYIEEGQFPNNSEVLIDKKYAEVNNLSIGDNIEVENKNYSISGFVVLPDMIYPIVDNTGSMYNSNSQALLVMTMEDYENIDVSETVGYVACMNSGEVTDELEDDSDFYMLQDSKTNPQIYSIINSKILINEIVLVFIIIIFSSITLFMLTISIVRQIREEAPSLGVLKALGYRPDEISKKYLKIGAIIVFPSAAGYIVGHSLTGLYFDFINSALILPSITLNLNYILLAIFTILPAIFFSIVAYYTSIRCLSKPPLALIKNINVSKNNKLVVKLNKKIKFDKFIKGLRRNITFSSLSAIIFVIAGGFSLGTLTQLAFTFNNITTNMAEDAMDGLNYTSDVRFKDTITDGDYGEILKYYGISIRLSDSEGKDVDSFELYAMDEIDNDLLVLTDSNDDKIDLSTTEGCVINEWMHEKYKLNVGDTVDININGEEKAVEIGAVDKSIYGKTIYIDFDEAKKLNLISDDEFNGILTSEKPTFDSDVHLSIALSEDISTSIMQSSDTYKINSVICLICGLAIGITVLSLAMFNVINDQRKYIALMKVNGYTDKECSFAAISGFRISAYIGYFISVPYTYMVGLIMFKSISMNSDMIYSLYIDGKTILICFVITLIIIECIIVMFKKKLSKISFKEIMEDR